jgi:hypothetical protein
MAKIAGAYFMHFMHGMHGRLASYVLAVHERGHFGGSGLRWITLLTSGDTLTLTLSQREGTVISLRQAGSLPHD